MKEEKDLVCEYILLSNIKYYKEARIQKYFRIREKDERCVGKCGGERMGNVYYKSGSVINKKRYIAYCINCFSKVTN